MAFHVYLGIQYVVLLSMIVFTLITLYDSAISALTPSGRSRDGLTLGQNLGVLVSMVGTTMVVAVVFAAIDKLIGA